MKHPRYIHRQSPHLQYVSRMFGVSFNNVGSLDASAFETHLTTADKAEVIQQVEETIEHIAQMFGEDRYTPEGVDLVRLEVGALAAFRVRLFPIMRFIQAATRWVQSTQPHKVSVWPSGHYTDWLLSAVCAHAGVRVSLVSHVSAVLGRMLLWFSDKRIYRPRTFVAAQHIPTDLPELLFVATVENHVKNLLPLMRAAVAREVRVGLVASSSMRSWSCLEQIPREVERYNFRDFITEEDLAIYAEDSRLWQERFKAHTQHLQTLCVYNGVHFWPLVKPGLADWYATGIPQNLLYMRIARRIMSLRPQGLVCSRLLRASESALFAVARSHGVPTTMVLHGLITDEPDFHFASGRFDLTEVVYVWNRSQQAYVEQKSTQTSRVIIDANPQWERMLTLRADRAEILKNAGFAREYIEQGTRLVTFTAQPKNGPLVWNALVEVAAEVPTTLLIIKTHPHLPKEKILASLPTLPGNVVVVDDAQAPLYPLLKVSDLLITVTSTTFFEALVMGVPAVLYRAHSFGFVDELVHYGMPVARTKEDLRALCGPDRTVNELWEESRTFREQYLASIEGRVAGVCDRIIDTALGTKGPKESSKVN